MHKLSGVSEEGRGGCAASCAGPAALFAVDARGVFTLLEGGGLLGLCPDAGMDGRSVFDACRGTPAVAKGVRHALAGESFSSVVEADGATFRCSYDPLRDADGAVVGAVCVASGCTGERAGCLRSGAPEPEGEGRAHGGVEERFRLVARATKEAIWDSDLLADRQVWEGAVEDVLGYPSGQVTDTAWWEERVHPEDRRRALSKVAEALEGTDEAWSDEYRFRRSDGSYAVVSDRAFVVRDPFTAEPVRMLGSMADVTEKRRAEAALRKSEERFRIAFERAAVGMAHVSPCGDWLRVNDKLCEIVGYAREELLSLAFRDITHPDDRNVDLRHAESLLAGEIDDYSVEKRYLRKDRSRVWAALTVSLVRDASGEPDHFVSVIEDVTARKLRELIPDGGPTPRELEVLRLVAEGKTNAEISRSLRYSVATVKLCVGRLIANLGVKNRKQAAARAVDIGLLPPSQTARSARATKSR